MPLVPPVTNATRAMSYPPYLVAFLVSRNCPGLLMKPALQVRRAFAKDAPEMKMPGARPGISVLAICAAVDRLTFHQQRILVPLVQPRAMLSVACNAHRNTHAAADAQR